VLSEITDSIIVCLFSEAGELVSSHRVDGESMCLEQKLVAAVRGARGKAQTKSLSLPQCYLHVLILTYTADFANFGIRGLFDNMIYEPHVTGLTYSLDGRQAELNPLQSLTKNFGPKMARAHLARTLGFDPESVVAKTELQIGIYRVLHFGESFPDHEPLRFHRGHRVIAAEDVCYDVIQNSLRLVGRWYENNVDENGEVTYEYYPATAKYDNVNRTIVRSTMAVWILNKLATFLEDDQLGQLGKRGIDYYLHRFFRIDESLARGKIVPTSVPTDKGELPINRFTSASFLIMAILEREELSTYRREVDLLWQWVSRYQRDDGFIWTQFAQSQYFDTGQLLLAAASLYEHTQDAQYAEFFERSARFYSKQVSQMLELGNGLYAPYAPAWFTQPLARMYQLTHNPQFRDDVYAINERVTRWYRVNTEHKAHWDYDGILAPKGWTYGNVSITAASLESLVDAAYVAKTAGDTTRYSKFMEIIPHTVAYLLRLQFVPENTYYLRDRERVIGGFKTDLVNSKVWCDNVWHLTGAFMKIVENDLLPQETA